MCDGAVVVLDGYKGVQAQTVTVWNQLSKWDTPRLIFINKLDRSGASLVREGFCVYTKCGNEGDLCVIDNKKHVQ